MPDLDPFSRLSQQLIRRKVFISHSHIHQAETDWFVHSFGDVFITKAVGTFRDDNRIDSTNPDYTMSVIRSEYIGDSTVTIVLLGCCTHSRRYVDWEIKGSLMQGKDRLPNGLIGILMPSAGAAGAHLPERFAANWARDQANCYARYYNYPSSKELLRTWIEDAFAARSSRAHLIKNSNATMWSHNRTCNIHGVIH